MTACEITVYAAYEMALVDTKLFQRLRRVHQTGAVYLVYPSARHSRFEHLQLFLHQVTKMCTELDRETSDRKQGEPLRAKYKPQLTFAALLHDVGHGPFSHTSEQFFSRDPDFGVLKAEIGWPQDRRGDIGEGEILSYLIITSKPLREFVMKLNGHCEIAINLDEIGKYIAGCSMMSSTHQRSDS